MPWKNGGGSTTELAIFPPGATLDDFVWRLSSAHVGSAGPFSQFAGVDRSLAILSGGGLILHFHNDGSPPTCVSLSQDSQSCRFPGERAIHAQLCDGPVQDLNLMTRRDHCEHSMCRLEVGEHSLEVAEQSKILLYCVAGSVTILADESLQAGDLAMFDEAGSRFQFKVEEETVLYLMRVTNRVAR